MKTKRYCLKCGKELSKNCKGEYCGKHRDRSGANNPFYGKTHTAETKRRIVKQTRAASKKLWENESYRKKVIEGVSKPRNEEGKKNISNAVSEWYKSNPDQRIIRSQNMKRMWEDSVITIGDHGRSRLEDEFFSMLEEHWGCFLERKVIKIGGRQFLPDRTIPRYHIHIEFYGDFWHGNPRKYDADDILMNGITAKEIWDRDSERIAALQRDGHVVIVVWESDFKNNKHGTVSDVSGCIEELCNI